MNNIITNKLASFATTLNIADKEQFAPVWTRKSPELSSEGLAEVRGMLKATASKGADQSAPITGAAEARRNLRTNFEKWLHLLARATFRTLTRLARTEDAAKADVAPTDLARARALARARRSTRPAHGADRAAPR